MVPEANVERATVILLMFLGGLVWAVVLGNIAGLYSALYPQVGYSKSSPCIIG